MSNFEDGFKELNKAMEALQKALNQAEKAVNLGLKATLSNASKSDILKAQKAEVVIKKLMREAKEGKNIDSDVKKFSKEFTQKDRK